MLLSKSTVFTTYQDDLPVIQSDKKSVSRDKQRHVILIAV